MNIVLALSLLLAVGFALARFAKLLHLPSVTGYLLAGLALGPSGLDLIDTEAHGEGMHVFTNIALMLVAFGIGERFDLQQLAPSARALTRVSLGESAGAFVLVALTVGPVAWLSGIGGGEAGLAPWVSVALVCASIAVATAPAATVAVIRESEASGPITRLVLSSVVVNNALSVTLFGLTTAAARALLGTAPGATGGASQAIVPIVNVVASLVLGVGVGWLCDLVVHKLSSRADVLVAALAAVFFVGGLASYLGLSALLAGVGAGFAVVNRDRRDVRAFRALNDFEPPLYGIFFALAGAQLHLQELVAAGAMGAAFIVARAAGKYFGAWLGAKSAGMPPEAASAIGLGLLPQAGLAIGLAYLVRQDPGLEAIRSFVINVVVASVVINELAGPPLVRMMLLRAGEIPEGEASGVTEEPQALAGIDVVPWTWPKLTPPDNPAGHVIAGLAHPGTAAGVTRIATLIADYYRATPVAVHVVTGHGSDDFWDEGGDQDAIALFRIADHEARTLGYALDTEVEFAQEAAEGLLRASEETNAEAIVVGHPLVRRAPRFYQIVDGLARDALCPVVVIRFAGAMHTERILVPFSTPEEFAIVRPLTCALGAVMEHQITLLRLMAPEARDPELAEASSEVTN
ncbi:MAG TPA: cation:proton antiporter, partial [Armatimonadota bacterium]|nr:cation:proton antiporter [Armatimonadota bacterium]